MPQPLKASLTPIDLGPEPIHTRLQRLRKQRGITQAQLAQLIGVTTNAVSAYEVGRVRLVDEVIVRCALALGVSADELLGLTNLSVEEPASLKIMRRVQKISHLPPAKQKIILQNIDMAILGVTSQAETSSS